LESKVLFDWLPGRKKEEPTETQKVMMHSVLLGDSQRPVSQTEMMEQLGINIHLFRSSQLEGAIKQLYKIAVDEKGSVDLDLVALATLTDGLIRVSRISKLDSHIGYLKTRRILRRIEMNSPPIEGIINLLEAIELERMTAWSDAEGGWKAKLTKVTPRTYEISMVQPGKREGMP